MEECRWDMCVLRVTHDRKHGSLKQHSFLTSPFLCQESGQGSGGTVVQQRLEWGVLCLQAPSDC